MVVCCFCWTVGETQTAHQSGGQHGETRFFVILYVNCQHDEVDDISCPPAQTAATATPTAKDKQVA